ncbi:peptide chain release factor N(5)-glutamine methyltransferase [bacterium]|jgi:release factor glutamine methyltransferase|nr:peptide chain release factor N(5)-glutamine methyltransferase [bacterium]
MDKIQESFLNNLDLSELTKLKPNVVWWLLEEITKKNRAQLFAQKQIILSKQQKEIINEWVNQLTKEKKPLAYVLGWTPFSNLKIYTEPPTLIPRPETEEWVLDLVNKIKKNKIEKQFRILDIGTGTGCVALTLAKKIPNADVVAIDISEKALQLAKKNAAENKIENVTFLKSDLFENLGEIKFDMIVSNPPYISEQDWKGLEQHIKGWEDPQALKAKNDGLEIIENIIQKTPQYLKPAGINLPNLVIEIGYNQGEAVRNLLTKKGFKAITIEKDFSGKNRVACGKF